MNDLESFERIVRRAGEFTDEEAIKIENIHPFQIRSIHEKLPSKVRRLFDDGHYAEATFEAFKFIDKRLAALLGIADSGQKLMMAALSDDGPLRLNALVTESERDEQRGYKFMLAGAMSAVRNPRGHEYDMLDEAETCLDHLSLVSLFIRRIEEAGYTL